MGSTTAMLELLSVCSNAALKIKTKGHQRNVDGLFVFG
jgi:hypothetical protein